MLNTITIMIERRTDVDLSAFFYIAMLSKESGG